MDDTPQKTTTPSEEDRIKYIAMLKKTLDWLNSPQNKDIIHNTAFLRKLVPSIIEYTEINDSTRPDDEENEQSEPVVEVEDEPKAAVEDEDEDEPEAAVEDYEKSKPKVKEYDGQYDDQVGGSRRVRFFNMFKKLTRRFKSKKSRGKRRMNKSKKCSKKKSKRRR